MSSISKDGFQWTNETGLRQGVPSIGVIQPPTNLASSENIYDVVVVGAGYTALTATRDLTTAGLKVLLLEARDRIGGRSWSSNIDGYPYEMGGTWVNWGQAHVWREIARYGMSRELEVSQEFSHGVNHFVLTEDGKSTTMSHEEEDAITESGLLKFVNVDGEYGRKVIPFPHDAELNPEALLLDRLSAADRLSQIRDTLTPREYAAAKGFILLCSGGKLAEMSFFEFLKWWALSGYTYVGCIEYLVKYKFRGGQSSFAINFWNEALATRNLSYVFNCPVKRIQDTKGAAVAVTAEDGRTFRARRLVCTIPLNVLSSVAFEPPLSPARREAAEIGHGNMCVKVHAEVAGTDLRSWSTTSPDEKLLYAFGDGTTPAGNTHIVAFGSDDNHLDEPEKDIEVTKSIFQKLSPMNIKRVVFHNWSSDPYAKGAWFYPRANFISRYLTALRTPSATQRVYFASSDWALGWRSFIDGAIEEGTRAAIMVRRDLAGEAGKARL